MSLYLLINIAVIFVPLLFSFEKKIKFYKKLPDVFFSMIITGIPFIIWDAVAASRGDWNFIPDYTLEYKIAGLPVEEILFFITVPYAILFLYETYLFYLPKIKESINYRFLFIPFLLSIISTVVFFNKYYTFTVFLLVSFLFLLLAITKPGFLKRKYFPWFLLFTFIPFGIVNYFLTSVPVVTYKTTAILGIRITTIPIEDFFYSFSLVTLYIYFYEFAKEKWEKRIVQ